MTRRLNAAPPLALVLALLVLSASCSGAANSGGPAPTGLAASEARDATPAEGPETTGGNAVASDPSTISDGSSSTTAPAVESADPPPGELDADGLILLPGPSGAFTSPTGNIACSLTQDGGASCYIAEKQWTIEEPEGCAGLDYGNAVEVDATGSAYSCYTDFPWNTAAEALPYGSAMAVGEILCESERTGVTCRHSSGAGFTVARAAAELF